MMCNKHYGITEHYVRDAQHGWTEGAITLNLTMDQFIKYAL